MVFGKTILQEISEQLENAFEPIFSNEEPNFNFVIPMQPSKAEVLIVFRLFPNLTVTSVNFWFLKAFLYKAVIGLPLYSLGTFHSPVKSRVEVTRVYDYNAYGVYDYSTGDILNGDGTGLNLSEDMIRILVINERTQEYIKNK